MENTQNTHTNGQQLPALARDRLRALVETCGQYEAANRLGVGASTVARALAGLGIRRATATAIVRGLDAIQAGQAA